MLMLGVLPNGISEITAGDAWIWIVQFFVIVAGIFASVKILKWILTPRFFLDFHVPSESRYELETTLQNDEAYNLSMLSLPPGKEYEIMIRLRPRWFSQSFVRIACGFPGGLPEDRPRIVCRTYPFLGKDADNPDDPASPPNYQMHNLDNFYGHLRIEYESPRYFSGWVFIPKPLQHIIDKLDLFRAAPVPRILSNLLEKLKSQLLKPLQNRVLLQGDALLQGMMIETTEKEGEYTFFTKAAVKEGRGEHREDLIIRVTSSPGSYLDK